MSYEYCQEGCDDLGEWVIESFATYAAAEVARMALDGPETVSAFIVQPPSPNAGALLLRRERKSRPAVRPSALPYWTLQSYSDVLTAAADAAVTGGWVYPTNGGPGVYLRVWFVSCSPGINKRQRLVRP